MDKNHEVFDDYVMKFDFGEDKIKYKYNHSYRVMNECKKLAESLDFDEEGVFLSMIIGLFHDIGRFKQWSEFKTFSDKDSANHAEMSCDVLFKEGLIDSLEIPDNSEEVISKAIYNHNKISYDDSDYDEAEVIFCKIIRDADKLDILRNFLDVVMTNRSEGNISEKVRKDFFDNKLISKEDVMSKNDKVVLILSLVFDLNFEYSKKVVIEEGIIKQIFESFDKDIFKEYIDEVNRFLKESV